jgi:GntR family transcriptional regulator/MocR family aminotransferase
VAIGSRAGADPVPFQLGVPAFDEFPARIWERLERARWRAGGMQLGEGDPAGDPALRVAIAEYVVSARGARCSFDQVIVTSGTQQSLDLAARLLLDPGDAAWIEDPAYPGAVATLRASGADIVPVPVDADGLDVAAGERRRPRARMAYVTPSHQFPLGVVMSASRRLALLAWARDANAWIFEDDYDSEFRYGGRPLPCLQGLDAESAPAGSTRVLYAGTFNKTLAHGLRVGYLIVPDQLADPLRAARVATTGQPPALHQGALADFIGEGHYARHLRRLRGIYEERQRALLEGADEVLSGRLTLEPDGAGLHLVGRLAGGADDVAVAKAARRAGVEVYPLSSFAVDAAAAPEPGLLLGYAPFDRIAIRRGLRRLRGVL